MCLGTKSDDSSVKGKYCLTSIQVEVPRSPYLAAIYNLMHAHSQLKSNLQDVSTYKRVLMQSKIIVLEEFENDD